MCIVDFHYGGMAFPVDQNADHVSVVRLLGGHRSSHCLVLFHAVSYKHARFFKDDYFKHVLKK